MGHDHHDHHEGQRVSRRAALAGISSIGLGALLAACGSPKSSTSATTTTGATASISPQATTGDLTALFAGAGTCTLSPGTTQGPYYFDADKIRSDIREDREGVKLRIAIRVQDSEACGPLANAVVEIWHCDAAGLYSGAESLSSGGGGGGGPGGGTPPTGAPPSGGPGGGSGGGGGGGGGGDLTPTDDKRYLRGAQVTNADGIVQFTTIWPGWYVSRTVHIHAMVHIDNERTLTTQLMMDESLNSKVFAQQPYAKHTNRDTFNDGDSIYKESMLLKITEDADGYLGVITFGVDPDHDGK
ncbi:protocatechuate 3,4-dioxygenase beta subunit [Kitasatospora gansuensis]|uniref:Protocatechuate 3,4-dioxygenase beta subunit n=1 Tax=Kitasatospora gansuensis TaxID=258050 RepID=A0A7W7S989_9ACTN|nr:intradiol ring-cleavage dioxygenase [Kitasatospora gansuensis]MBB4946279.1 protocatechuate 3,4-dioxygenase beta subunit [Kitasatospora gansuensis]